MIDWARNDRGEGDRVSGDNTIWFDGEVYQLERQVFGYSYAGQRADLREIPGNPISSYVDGKLVGYKKLLTVPKEGGKSQRRAYGKVAILSWSGTLLDR